MAFQIITANDLVSGLVVYQAKNGDWCSLVQDAELIETDEALQACLVRARAAEGEQCVVGAYEIDVTVKGSLICPVQRRERIRAYGPTSHAEFGRGISPEESPGQQLQGNDHV